MKNDPTPVSGSIKQRDCSRIPFNRWLEHSQRSNATLELPFPEVHRIKASRPKKGRLSYGYSNHPATVPDGCSKTNPRLLLSGGVTKKRLITPIQSNRYGGCDTKSEP